MLRQRIGAADSGATDLVRQIRRDTTLRHDVMRLAIAARDSRCENPSEARLQHASIMRVNK
jgi:hypothetical protein